MEANGDKVGKCCMPDCEVVLVLDDQSKHSACKHKTQKMFLGGEFKEKYSNEIEIKGVSEGDLVVFLSSLEPLKPLPTDADALCSLIFLSDRFVCPKMKEEIQAYLETKSMYDCAPPATKLNLLEAADNNKGESTGILEACVRLCANLTVDEVYRLQGKVSSGTLTATLVIIGQMLESERLSTAFLTNQYHYCSVDRVNQAFDGPIYDGQFHCTKCSERKGIPDQYKPSFEKMKNIEIKKELLA